MSEIPTGQPRPADAGLRRDLPIEPAATALLLVDVQNLEIADRIRREHPVCVADCCSSYTAARHDGALRAFGGYCRTVTLEAMLDEIAVAG